MAPNPNKPYRVCDNFCNKLKKAVETDASSEASMIRRGSLNQGSTDVIDKSAKLDTRRPSPSRSTTPTPTLGGLTSPRIVVDDAKRTNESLSQEVTKLRAQVETLTRKAQLQEVELERTSKQLKEAISIAGEETAKCKAAKEVIKSLTSQLKEMAERLPVCPGRNIKSPKSVSSESNITSSDIPNGCIDQVHSQLTFQELESSVSNSQLLSNGSSNASNHSAVHNKQGYPETTTKNGARTKECDSHNENEWVEQDEPGVYITLTSLPGGVKDLQRVRFRYYYNKVTRTSKWRMPDEVKLAREKDTISHASDFGSISVVKTSSPSADGSLVLAHGAKSSPIAVSLAANLPTIVSSESSSLSGKVSSPMIETVEIKNSSEPALPAVANSKKIGIVVTLGNSVAPPVSETTTTQDTVVYGDGFSSENRENVKNDAAITEIGGATLSNEKTVELGPLVYESKAEAKSAFKTLLESANIGSDCTWDQEHAKALEEQNRNRVEYLEFLKSCDFIKDRLETDEQCSYLEKIDRLEIFQEYIRDLESEEEEQRKLRMEELRKAERKNRDEFRKLMEEHVATIKDFAAYLAVSSNTLGSTAKDLFIDVMDELEK
ncbi:hypothetical protein T459_28858 [Capsicum annuum]|uniref:BRX domain-containing protein n=1 Tax=Capsicum annuum TaxID=4072 RepID=A0A2G2YIF3_CAPAN|nr:hypothetical protein T459_28858 [Capsicum annuum]